MDFVLLDTHIRCCVVIQEGSRPHTHPKFTFKADLSVIFGFALTLLAPTVSAV